MAPEKTIDKIQRLLELSKSDNIHEAGLAAMRAQELMEKHKLSMTDVEAHGDEAGWKPGPINEHSIEVGKVAHKWALNLMHHLCRVNQCSYYFIRARRDRWERKNDPAKICIFGRHEDITTVTYMYRFLFVEIGRLCDLEKKHAKKRGEKTSRTWTTSFRLGAVSEVGSRLQEAQRNARDEARTEATSSTAIMRVNSLVRQMDDWANHVRQMMYRNHNLKQVNSTSSKILGDAYTRGQRAGANIDLHGNKKVTGGNLRLNA